MRVTISVTRPATLDQTKADRVELGITPERCPGRQAAQGERQPYVDGPRLARLFGSF
jgi:hypothetical protein